MLSFFLATVVPEKITNTRFIEKRRYADSLKRPLYIAPPFDQDSLISNIPNLVGLSQVASEQILNDLVGMKYIGDTDNG